MLVLTLVLARGAAAGMSTSTGTPPANFSCAIGEAGLRFARHIQPERTNLSGVVERLVTPHCPSANADTHDHDPSAGRPSQPGHGLWGWRASVPHLPTLHAHANAHAAPCTFYVDGVNGKDAAGGGSQTAPFKTIAYAVASVPRSSDGSSKDTGKDIGKDTGRDTGNRSGTSTGESTGKGKGTGKSTGTGKSAGKGTGTGTGTGGCTVLLVSGLHYVQATITVGSELVNLTIMPVRHSS